MATIDAGLGPDTLRQLLVRYPGTTENPLSEQLLSRSRTEVAIIIKPLKLYSWNYSERMRDSTPDDTEKPCPE